MVTTILLSELSSRLSPPLILQKLRQLVLVPTLPNTLLARLPAQLAQPDCSTPRI